MSEQSSFEERHEAGQPEVLRCASPPDVEPERVARADGAAPRRARHVRLQHRGRRSVVPPAALPPRPQSLVVISVLWPPPPVTRSWRSTSASGLNQRPHPHRDRGAQPARRRLRRLPRRHGRQPPHRRRFPSGGRARPLRPHRGPPAGGPEVRRRARPGRGRRAPHADRRPGRRRPGRGPRQHGAGPRRHGHAGLPLGVRGGLVTAGAVAAGPLACASSPSSAPSARRPSWRSTCRPGSTTG